MSKRLETNYKRDSTGLALKKKADVGYSVHVV